MTIQHETLRPYAMKTIENYQHVSQSKYLPDILGFSIFMEQEPETLDENKVYTTK